MLLQDPKLLAAFWFEIGVIALGAIMTGATLVRYFQKQRNPVTLLLFEIFLSWTLAIVFSWMSKLMALSFDGDNISFADPGGWFLTKIRDFRISFVFVTVALWLSYLLRTRVFEKKARPASKVFFGIMAIVVGVFSGMVHDPDMQLLDVVDFLLVFVYMALVYFPFMSRTIDAAKHVPDKDKKTAFASLAVMSLCFVLVFFMFFVDRLFVVFFDDAFTVFYFAAWALAVAGIVSAYLGYIRPRGR